MTNLINRIYDFAASRAGPLDVYEFNEQASDPDPPAADDWALFFRQDGNLYKIDENGTVSQVGGGGSASIAIEDDGTEILGAVSTIDFAGSDFGVSNPTGDEVQVVLTSDSLTVTAGNALTGGGSVALGGSTSLAVDETAIDLSNLSGTLSAGQLADGAVTEAKLNAADAPASGEVLTWNGSQLEWQPDDTGSGGSRVLYGPVADRPAAGDVPDGTVYLITDLANNGGVLTEVVAGAWQLKQIGDDANRPDIVAGTGDFNSVVTEELNNANAVINNDSPDPNVRIINVSDDSSTDSGETIDLFKFPHGGANATVAGVADIMQGFVNGDSPVFSSVEFQKSSNTSWSGTTSPSSELDLVPINGGDELVFRVTSTQDFARIACFCRVWTSAASPIEVLVNR